jgi:hypothetical protein
MAALSRHGILVIKITSSGVSSPIHAVALVPAELLYGTRHSSVSCFCLGCPINAQWGLSQGSWVVAVAADYQHREDTDA